MARKLGDYLEINLIRGGWELGKLLQRIFGLQRENTNVRTELLAGLTSFVTAAYIIVVNGTILSSTGMPYEGAIIATILVSFLGCLLMALWANSPVIIIPGMGDNAFFVFTLVASIGLTWQQSLSAVFMAGIIFLIVAATKVTTYLSQSIPKSMIAAMTAGIGFFITFLGLKNGGVIIEAEGTFVKLASFNNPYALTTILTLIILIPLFLKNVKGSFLIGIIAGTCIGAMLGIVDFSSLKDFSISFGEYKDLFLALDFSAAASFEYWTAVFSLSLVIIFQNMASQLGMLPDKSKFKRSFQANALSVISAGLLGCSPSTTAAETATGVTAGGRTGLTSLTTSLLFLVAIFFIPFLKVIPNSAIAPVLIIVGCLMMTSIKDIPHDDFTESFPAYLMMIIMPLSFSIANGIAFGFIAYPLLKLFTKRKNEVSGAMYILAFFFLLYFFLSAI